MRLAGSHGGHADKWGRSLAGFLPCAFAELTDSYFVACDSESLTLVMHSSQMTCGCPGKGITPRPRSSALIEARPLIAAEKFELLELVYRRLPNGKRLKPSTKALLHLFADCVSSLHWSQARIAETLGYSRRTIVTSMNELREWGILTSVRLRRQTAQRYIWLDKAREITSLAVSSIKQRCAIALSALRTGLDVKSVAHSNHRFRKEGVTEALAHLPVASVSDLSPSLRAWAEREKAAGRL